MIALHLFNLLFLRLPSTKLGLAATLCFGWASVATIVTVGPVMIQTPEKGPYFGISGNWYGMRLVVFLRGAVYLWFMACI
jgi:hypothetical protein